ncbi:MAG TPA: ABC transporter permease subunit [Chitinophagales bacterium]|nr:ABC transporter permease subunit [Chitinophagales bacterium]
MKTSGTLPIVLFLLLIVLPFSAGLLYAVLYSFGIIGLLNHGFTFDHWKIVFTSSEVVRSFLFTMGISVVALMVSLLLALLFVITASKDKNGSASWFIYLPLTLPAMVAAFFTFQFLSRSGFVSRIFNALGVTNGIDGFPDLVNDTFGIGILITHVLLAVPFFIILFQNYYQAEKLAMLRELADTLGATASQFNRKILIPVLLKKSAAPLALYFLFMLGSFEIPLLLGQQDPQMISVLINRKLSRFDLNEIPQGYIIAILYSIVVLLLLLFVIKIKKRADA